MRSEQDPDKYLYIMDSCCDCLNACDPHNRVQQTVNLRVLYCKLYQPNIRQFDKPTWIEVTSDLPVCGV